MRLDLELEARDSYDGAACLLDDPTCRTLLSGHAGRNRRAPAPVIAHTSAAAGYTSAVSIWARCSFPE
jgi:hypothetical protein